MKLSLSILISVGLVVGVEALKFILPPNHRSRSNRVSSSSTSSDSSSSESSSDSSVEYIKNEDGRFSHLRKDDDLLAIKKRKKKKKKKSIKTGIIDSISSDRKGGKQAVGFVWQKQFIEELKLDGVSENGFSEDLNKLTAGIVTQPINAGWWLFTFGNGKNSVSKTSFKFKSRLPVRISLVDVFCRGDSFGVLDSGRLVAQTSRVPADKECDKSDRMISPQEALKDGRWSSVVFDLEAGDHEITLKTVDSPMENGGVAAIKFDHVLPARRPRKLSRNKVCRGYNGLIVITEPMPAEEAELACLNMKTDLARVGYSKDEIIVKRSIKTCSTNNNGQGKVWAVDVIDEELKVFGRDGKVCNENSKNRNEKEKLEKYPVLCMVRS